MQGLLLFSLDANTVFKNSEEDFLVRDDLIRASVDIEGIGKSFLNFLYTDLETA